MFNGAQVQALAGPLKDIQRLVLLEDEPSPRAEVLSSLEQVFIKDLSVVCPFIFPLIRTSLPVTAAEKHPHSMMLTPPCFTVGLVPGFIPTLGIQAKEFNLGYIRSENLDSHGLRVL